MPVRLSWLPQGPAHPCHLGQCFPAGLMRWEWAQVVFVLLLLDFPVLVGKHRLYGVYSGFRAYGLLPFP